jgi:GNAT superfamily N-acetyltransferase
VSKTWNRYTDFSNSFNFYPSLKNIFKTMNQSEIRLRNANFSDSEAIASLHTASWQKHYRGILTNSFLDSHAVAWHQELWRGRLQHPSATEFVTVAEKNGEIVGFSCLFIDENPLFGSLLDNLHISFSCQKAGIGKLLFDRNTRLTKEFGKEKKMYWWVYDKNENALNFYQHLGGQRNEAMMKQGADQSQALSWRYVWSDREQ